MQLTDEQEKIITSNGDIKINAVAGSGKTTTVIEYAKNLPSTARILYLVFNKSVKEDAKKKFLEKGVRNVTIETAHSLAFRHIVRASKFKIRHQGYKPHELCDLLAIEGNSDKNTKYVIANHVSKLCAQFCNGDKQKVAEINYLDSIEDEKAKQFVKSYLSYIVQLSRVLLAKMNKGEIEITHDFYLKKFQLAKPILNFDYILFDEGQDASPTMLDVFLNQNATKVIVGDKHQQIYGWRQAINSLEKVSFTNFNLSNSFRFSQDIADLAYHVIEWKEKLNIRNDIKIQGKGTNKLKKPTAVIGRTNLGLLVQAIESITDNPKIKKIHFEGNINSYTYAEDGASLYDILNLENGKKHLIRDGLIKSMNTTEDLRDYIEKTEDAQLGLMIGIVEEYGNEIIHIIQKLKDLHVTNEEKDTADLIFSTVHRSKGMEYDSVLLVNDFINEQIIKKQLDNEDGYNPAKLSEEINLLYVAITRAKHCLHIPESLLPFGYKPKTNAIKLITVKEEEKESKKEQSFKPYPKKDNYMSKVKEKHKKAYQPWTTALDDQLRQKFFADKTISDIAKEMGRTKGSIMSRLRKLGVNL